MSSYIKPITCFLIAILMGGSFLVFMTPPVRRDSADFRSAGIEVSKGNNDVLARPGPGYPIFLGICFKMLGINNDAVRIVQILLSGFTSLMVYFFASRYYGENVGFIAGLLYSICPTFGYYPPFFLRETLMVFLFFLSHFLVMKTLDSNSIFIALSAAFSLTLTLLTKPIFLFFGIFVVSFVVIFHREYIHWNRRAICVVAVIVLLPIICFSGFGYWLQKENSHIVAGGGIGKNLLYNGSELALSDKEKAARLIGLISRNFSEKLFPDINFRTLWPYPDVVTKLMKEADSKYSHLPNRQDRFLHTAFDLYKEHPFAYLINRITTLIRLNAFQYPSRLNETDRWKDFYNRGNNKSLLVIILDLILKLISNPFFWALGGFVVMKKLKLPILPVLLPVLYVNLVYCFLDGIPRYGLPALPFYLISGAVMFVYGVKKIKHKFAFFNFRIQRNRLVHL